MASEWNIHPRAAACAVCGAPFEPGSTGVSVLLPAEGSILLRRDLCTACFADPGRPERDARLSAWKFTVPTATPKEAKSEPVQRETAIYLLTRLLEAGRPEDIGVIYLLAILLERSRQLIERRVTREPDGRKVRLYEHRATGSFYAVTDPGLEDADIAPLQQQIIRLLDSPAPQPSEPETP